MHVLVSLAMDAPFIKTLGITHLNDSGLYTSTENDMLRLVQAANALLKWATSTPPSTPGPSNPM